MFRSILVPIDVAEKTSWQFALPQAIELASAGDAALTVLTVVREINAVFAAVQFAFQVEAMMAEARRRLATIVADHAAAGRRIEQEVRFGSISGEILASARERGADLIVMASHRPELLDRVIGPNAAYVAEHAACSVLVLRRFSA